MRECYFSNKIIHRECSLGTKLKGSHYKEIKKQLYVKFWKRSKSISCRAKIFLSAAFWLRETARITLWETGTEPSAPRLPTHTRLLQTPATGQARLRPPLHPTGSPTQFIIAFSCFFFVLLGFFARQGELNATAPQTPHPPPPRRRCPPPPPRLPSA